MAVYASYQGISFELVETRRGEWNWSFAPPRGARRSGRVIGKERWAFAVVYRAIEVWHQMNPGAQNAAA
jgi:hypothetical protein